MQLAGRQVDKNGLAVRHPWQCDFAVSHLAKWLERTIFHASTGTHSYDLGEAAKRQGSRVGGTEYKNQHFRWLHLQNLDREASSCH